MFRKTLRAYCITQHQGKLLAEDRRLMRAYRRPLSVEKQVHKGFRLAAKPYPTQASENINFQ
jgi:hypothetical protein